MEEESITDMRLLFLLFMPSVSRSIKQEHQKMHLKCSSEAKSYWSSHDKGWVRFQAYRVTGNVAKIVTCNRECHKTSLECSRMCCTNTFRSALEFFNIFNIHLCRKLIPYSTKWVLYYWRIIWQVFCKI